MCLNAPISRNVTFAYLRCEPAVVVTDSPFDECSMTVAGRALLEHCNSVTVARRMQLDEVLGHTATGHVSCRFELLEACNYKRKSISSQRERKQLSATLSNRSL